MNITVFCGSYTGNTESYSNAAYALGSWIGKQHHTLVFGGGTGLMKKVFDGLKSENGKAVAVVPGNAMILSHLNKEVGEIIYTETMTERKQKMMNLADAFIALPGGMGTLDEITDVTVVNQIGDIKKPLVLYNVNDYYRPFVDFAKMMVEKGFARKELLDYLVLADSLPDIEKVLL